MNLLSPFRYIFFILIAILSLQACNSKPADDIGSAQDRSSMTAGSPSSSGYASDKEGWLANLNDAYAQSAKDHKPILVYFTASDTCGWCKQLEADVFSTPVFKSWSDKNVVLFRIDVPSRKRVPLGNEDQNTAMAQSLKVTTFPTIWILSVTHEVENGRFKVKPIGYTGFQPSPEKFIGVVQNFVRR